MTKADRRRFRRWGQWAVDHGLNRIGELLYAMAVADWEADQAWLKKYREKRALSGR